MHSAKEVAKPCSYQELVVTSTGNLQSRPQRLYHSTLIGGHKLVTMKSTSLHNETKFRSGFTYFRTLNYLRQFFSSRFTNVQGFLLEYGALSMFWVNNSSHVRGGVLKDGRHNQ